MGGKTLPKGTVAPATPDVIAFATQGDPRIYSKIPMSALFELTAKSYGAQKVYSASLPAATKAFVADYGLDPVTLAPVRAIKRVILIGHGGPSDLSPPQGFAFDGSPPAGAGPHNFSFNSALQSNLPYDSSHFLNLLAERLLPNALIWIVACYCGEHLGKAVSKQLKSAGASAVVGGYTAEIAFRWVPADGKKPPRGEALKPMAGGLAPITVATPFYDHIF